MPEVSVDGNTVRFVVDLSEGSGDVLGIMSGKWSLMGFLVFFYVWFVAESWN